MKRKRKSRTSIKNIRNNIGEMISKQENVANCLNEHFSSIGKTMASKFEKLECQNDPFDYISKKVEESITFCETSSSEILDVIIAQDHEKAFGYDEINS